MEQIRTWPVAEQQKQNIIQAVRNYGKRLYYFIRGKVNSDEDAEDILQDVWYQFSNVMNSEPVEQAGAWLYRVARNRIIDKYRKKEDDSLDELFDEDEENGSQLREILFSENTNPETELIRSAFWEALFAALEELPEEQKQVFVWHELDNLSFQEIEAKTGEKTSTLISRKRYAVLHLRERLKDLYKEIIEP